MSSTTESSESAIIIIAVFLLLIHFLLYFTATDGVRAKHLYAHSTISTAKDGRVRKLLPLYCRTLRTRAIPEMG